MARFEMLEQGFGGAGAQADILFELGMMYATGRDCDADMVAAHKWFNIAAIKGSGGEGSPDGKAATQSRAARSAIVLDLT